MSYCIMMQRVDWLCIAITAYLNKIKYETETCVDLSECSDTRILKVAKFNEIASHLFSSLLS